MWKFEDGTVVTETLQVIGRTKFAGLVKYLLAPGVTRTRVPAPGTVQILGGHKWGGMVQDNDVDDITWLLQQLGHSERVRLTVQPREPAPDNAVSRNVPPGAVI